MATKYVELKFQKYKDEMYMVECGYHKHMIYVDNCDVLNTLMLFSVLAFNKFVVKFPVDVGFWKQFIKFLGCERGIIKDIKFESPIFLDFCANKKNEERLFYSGGKDSTWTHYSKPEIKLIQYRVQVYKAPEIIGVETMSSNFDNELYHLDKRNMDTLKLEMYLPIISPYQTTWMGIEREIWEDGKGMLGYDLPWWRDILLRCGNVKLLSGVDSMYSYQILESLKNLDILFEHCQATDRENSNEFCYICEKCFTNYIQGCNLEEHGFDSEKWEERHKAMGQDISDLSFHVMQRFKEKREFLTKEKKDYFIKMIKQFGTNFRGKAYGTR